MILYDYLLKNMSVNPFHQKSQKQINDEIKKREETFWQLVYPVGDGHLLTNTYSPRQILHAIYTGTLNTNFHLYKPQLGQTNNYTARLKLDVSDYSHTIQKIILFTEQNRTSPLDTKKGEFEVCIQYKPNLIPLSIEPMQQIGYHFSYPNPMKGMTDLYPFLSLLSLKESSTFLLNDPSSGLTPNAQPTTTNECLKKILKDLAANHNTFVQRYDPINFEQNPQSTLRKWESTYTSNASTRVTSTSIGDNVDWEATFNPLNMQDVFLQCTLMYDQSLFLNAKNFVYFIKILLNTLAPGLPPEYKHVIAMSMSTKPRQAWANMSEEEKISNQSIFNRLPKSLVEHQILNKPYKRISNDE